MLKQLAWQVVETPKVSKQRKVIVLEASDVLYTGKEVFVGIRRNGTNMEGALVFFPISGIFSSIQDYVIRFYATNIIFRLHYD